MAKRLNIGEMIGEYRVTGFLGAGGMGEVYAGVHEKLGRPAAIKALGEAATSDATFKTRFLNEARLQAGLHHPNIAALYDFIEKDDQLFIFMELIDGENLDDLIKRRAFATEESLAVFASICEAIAYVHRHGIIHRDIKSQNVKLSSSGQVKLLDFGIAKDSSNPSFGLTQTGGVIGTPHYLAPEQLDSRPASPQTDIWALGVLLYEMLTGRVPFESESLAGLVLQITRVEFAAPEDINPAIPRDVSGIVKRCLQKDPARRFQAVDELIEAVRNVLNKEKTSAATALLGLKKSFTLVSNKQSAGEPHDAYGDEQSFENDSHSFAQSQAAEKKSFPVLPVIAAAGFALVFLIIAVGVGIWTFGGAENNKALATDTNVKKSLTEEASASAKPLKKIQIDVDEGSAEVFRAGQKLGATPFDLEAGEGEKIDLTLKRDGFEDKNITLEITSGKKFYTFQMKRK